MIETSLRQTSFCLKVISFILDYKYLVILPPDPMHCYLSVVLQNRGGTEPGSAQPCLARLISIRGKSSEKAQLRAGSKIYGPTVARLKIGSKNFGSQLGLA